MSTIFFEMGIIKRNFWILMTALWGGVFSVAGAEPFFSVSSTSSGEATQVRMSGLLSGEEVGFELRRPTDNPVSFSARADELGILKAEIFGTHLRRSGGYELRAFRFSNPLEFKAEYFVVSPGPVSAFRSKFEIENPSVAADGESESHFMITLKDAYGNPVQGQAVQIFSSQNEDLITAGLVSDEQGIIRGKVMSQKAGVSVLTALAGETLIFEKPEIIFYLADPKMKNVGASGLEKFLKAQLFDDQVQSVVEFVIEDLPAEIIADRAYTFRVVAQDENGDVVKNYLGEVRFTSTDNRANIPANYRFTPEDQGEHVFSLALTQGTPGAHELSLHAVSDFRIKGSRKVNVLASGGAVEVSSGLKKIDIISPSPATYRSSRITITGKATNVDAVKISDGPTVLSENTEVDASGNFVFQTPALADGLHKFIVRSIDESVSSEIVSIRIDRTPPRAIAVEVDPAGKMEPNAPFQIFVSSSEPLQSARCVFNEVLTELDNAGNKFVATLQSPRACGVYPVSCTVADLLGNELEEPNAGVIEVCAEDLSGTAGLNEGTAVLNDVPKVEINPTGIGNLQAQPGPGKVTLLWSPAADDTGIKNYQIEYGTAPDKLDKIEKTSDDRTQWYIEGLEDGQPYFFRVLAVDTEGNFSVASDIIESGTSGKGYKKSAPSNLEKAGAGTWMPIALAFFAGVLFWMGGRRSKQ